MGVEPEQVLEEQGVAAELGVEHADAERALQGDEQQGHRQHRGGQHQDDARGVQRPQEQRHPEPAHPRGAHGVQGDDEVQPGEDGGEADDEDADHDHDEDADHDHGEDADHDQGTNGLGQDPHVWFDPNNVIIWGENIAEALAEEDPERAALYRENAQGYQEELRDLDSWIRTQVDQIPPGSRKLVTDHTSFGYFAQEYGFEQVGAVIPAPTTEAETSGQQLAELIDTIRDQGVDVIFVSADTDPALSERVAEDTGAEVIPLYFGSLTAGEPADTYLKFMRYNVKTIVQALND